MTKDELERIKNRWNLTREESAKVVEALEQAWAELHAYRKNIEIVAALKKENYRLNGAWSTLMARVMELTELCRVQGY